MKTAVSTSMCLQVPCVQLAELLASQPCKMVVCGRGSAAAVAQQTAYQLQQSLRLSTSVEVRFLLQNSCSLTCWHLGDTCL